MKTRLFGLMLLVLLISLFSATATFADDGDDGNYDFKGTIVSLPATPGWIGDWVVSDVATDRVVHVTATTSIGQEHGPVAVNACVEVKGWLQGAGSVDATKIETIEPNECLGGDGGGYTEFYGIIESFPVGLIGDWVVSGTTVHVTAFTQIEQEHGPVTVDACVKVKGLLQGDGSMDASKIETKESSKCGGGGGPHVEFYGTIESLPSTPGWIGDWTVSGRTVHVTASTQIEQEHSLVAVGAYIEVKGTQQADGSIDATRIEVKMAEGGGGGGDGSYTKFYGTIESLPAPGWIGDWVVGGRTVHVDAATRIEQEDGPVAVGAYVEVKGWSQADGSVNAIKIEVKSSPGGGVGGGHTKFYGTVENLPAAGWVGDWTVSSRTVHVDATTRVEQEHGPVVVGAYVEVKGWIQADGSVNATKIEVKSSPGGGGGSTEFYGTVEQLPVGGLVGTWIVSGRTVVVDASTVIDQEHGPVAVGAYVDVQGLLQADGSVKAIKIEVKRGGGGGGGGGYVKFYGVVEDLPATGLVGDWLVSGRTVHVSATTRIEEEHGTVQIGAYVEVKGTQQADGSVDATKIEVKS